MKSKKKPSAAPGTANSPASGDRDAKKSLEGLSAAGFTKEDTERYRVWSKKRSHLTEPAHAPPSTGGAGNLPQIPTAIEQLRRDGLPPLYRESLESVYGFGDWRLVVCLVIGGADGKGERAELAEWLVGAIERQDGDELRAFAKCLDALGSGKQGSRGQNARALALHFCQKHFAQTGRIPTQAWVRRYLAEHGFPELALESSTMRKNEARDIFFGPVLGCLPKAKGGKPPSKKSKR